MYEFQSKCVCASVYLCAYYALKCLCIWLKYDKRQPSAQTRQKSKIKRKKYESAYEEFRDETEDVFTENLDIAFTYGDYINIELSRKKSQKNTKNEKKRNKKKTKSKK